MITDLGECLGRDDLLAQSFQINSFQWQTQAMVGKSIHLSPRGKQCVYLHLGSYSSIKVL